MEKISKEQQKTEKSVLIRKKIDPKLLGREVYADQVDTPYSIYLTRKLYLAKDYQKLAEGEAFFDIICENWDRTEEFKELVVKKIYWYVETEKMYFTLLLGSFEPLEKPERIKLKKWISALPTEKTTKALATTNPLGDVTELKEMMQRLMDTSGEMYHLRQTIFQLDEKIEQNRLELPSGNPVISRSIRTIHLKRAQPLVVDEAEKSEQEERKAAEPVIEATVVEEAPVKKPLTLVRESTSLPDEKKKQSKEENPSFEPESKAASLTTEKEVEQSSFFLAMGNAQQLFIADSIQFFNNIHKARQVKAPPKHFWVIGTDLEKLEDSVYFKFVSKRTRNYIRKASSPKVSIAKKEFNNKIKQAAKVQRTWEELFMKREEDVWICGRLSCINLVENLPAFIEEMQEIADNRNFIGLKIRCTTDLLNRLDGYILLNKYLRRLARQPKSNEAKKSYF